MTTIATTSSNLKETNLSDHTATISPVQSEKQICARVEIRPSHILIQEYILQETDPRGATVYRPSVYKLLGGDRSASELLENTTHEIAEALQASKIYGEFSIGFLVQREGSKRSFKFVEAVPTPFSEQGVTGIQRPKTVFWMEVDVPNTGEPVTQKLLTGIAEGSANSALVLQPRGVSSDTVRLFVGSKRSALECVWATEKLISYFTDIS
jgi:hypothetical protein